MDGLTLSVWVKVNIGVMAIKGYITLPRASEQEHHHQIQFSVITWTLDNKID